MRTAPYAPRAVTITGISKSGQVTVSTGERFRKDSRICSARKRAASSKVPHGACAGPIPVRDTTGHNQTCPSGDNAVPAKPSPPTLHERQDRRMGLDITAYQNAVPTPVHERTEDCYDNHVLAIAYDCFPHSFRGLADADKKFRYPHSDTTYIGGRCYDVTGSKRYAFHGGSYSGYNLRRDILSQTFLGVDAESVFRNPDRYADLPFFELVNFADNEGCIGPEAAADLFIDFQAGRSKWESEQSNEIDWYDRWITACALAADGGLIQFH